jgi:hypothetical protein
MLADMLSNFYSANNGFNEEFAYMRDFNFEQESETFNLMFDLGDEDRELFPTWILTEAEHNTFDGLYIEFSTEELVQLQQLINSAVEKLKEYEAKRLEIKRINVE